ncbi:sensor histidine kinase [Nocardia sp. NPDC058633]|uniref:sensor histidine kinase n=1 Tax=Nocardia sp. NPDC058633 TaxID=3346568 RepID=UPI003651E4E2
MRNGAALVLLAGAAQANGLFLDAVPLWRQMLYLVLAVVAFLHGRRLPFPREWTVLAALTVPGVVLTLVDFSVGSGVLGSFVLACALPWSAGRFRRQQAELLAASAERVTHLEQEQRLIAERAELRERTRIAADIHDSLGHDLALIALRAGALELAGELSEQNRQAAAELRAAAVTATDRLRSTIGVLRRAGPIDPHIEHVTAVVDSARSAGMVVTTQGFDGVPMPPLIERAVSYIVRESLTNAARHAPGAEVVIGVERTPTRVEVTIANLRTGLPIRATGTAPFFDLAVDSSPGAATDSRSASTSSEPPDSRPGVTSSRPPGPVQGTGIGLAGLRDRVHLLDGSFHASAEDDRFIVRARIPLDRNGASR